MKVLNNCSTQKNAIVAFGLLCVIMCNQLLQTHVFSTVKHFITLWHHFEHHHDVEDKGIGLLDFIQLHYHDTGHQGSGHEHHDELPFSHKHSSQIADSVQYIFNLLEYPSIVSKGIMIVSTTIHMYKDIVSIESLSSIWRPPWLRF